MDQGTEPIRQDIDQIRASMSEKMERIEAKIKGSVDETTSSMRRMVDVRYQVAQHPWAALGVAVLAGVALGSMGDDGDQGERWGGAGSSMSSAEAYERARGLSPYPTGYGASGYSTSYGAQGRSQQTYGGYGTPNFGSQGFGAQGYGAQGHSQQTYGGYGAQGYAPQGYTPQTGGEHTRPYEHGLNGGANRSEPPSQRAGLRDQIDQQFGGEIEALKGAAISSLVGLLRDTIRQSFPSLHQEMERLRREQGGASATPSYSAPSSTTTS